MRKTQCDELVYEEKNKKNVVRNYVVFFFLGGGGPELSGEKGSLYTKFYGIISEFGTGMMYLISRKTLTFLYFLKEFSFMKRLYILIPPEHFLNASAYIFVPMNFIIGK